MRLRIALVLTLHVPILHAVVLFYCMDNSYQEPIAVLSQRAWGELHTISLLLFGGIQIALSMTLRGLDQGWFWKVGRWLLFAAGLCLFPVAYFFATAPVDSLQGPEANDPLWVVASLIGFSMGFLQLGLSRLNASIARFNAILLAVWLLLIPAILLIGVISLGTYERVVGAVYVVWVAGMIYGLIRMPQPGDSVIQQAS